MANVVDPIEFSLLKPESKLEISLETQPETYRELDLESNSGAGHESVMQLVSQPVIGLSPERALEPTDAALNITLVLAAVITTICILCLVFAGFQLHHTNEIPIKTTLKDSLVAPASVVKR